MDAARLAATYDTFAKDYDANRGAFDMSEVLAHLASRLPATGRLLDLGCGAGEPVAASFLERGWQVTGVDFSAAFLELASRYVPAMARIHADMREARFPPRSFEAVTAIYSLFHVPRADHGALFARIGEWLVPGGVFHFTYATRAYTGADRFDGPKMFLGRELHYSHATPTEMVADLAAAGLGLAEARERDIGGETFLWVTAASPTPAG